MRREFLPRVEATVDWNWTDANILTDREWTEGSVAFTWTALAALDLARVEIRRSWLQLRTAQGRI